MFSEWLGPYESGETIYTNEPGVLHSAHVEIIAKDIYGAISEPSDPVTSKIKNPYSKNRLLLQYLEEIIMKILKNLNF